MCGKALKSGIAFQDEDAYEIHVGHIAGGPTFPDSKAGGDTEAVCPAPGRDFTQPRTLSFETVISLLLAMSENSVEKALMERFKNGEDTPSASAFCPAAGETAACGDGSAFPAVCCLRPAGRFQGYRLLAADGSDLKSAAYPGDPASYRPGAERHYGWNLWHLNALYDLQNGIYTDVIVQKEHEKDEKAALCAMVLLLQVKIGKQRVEKEAGNGRWMTL